MAIKHIWQGERGDPRSLDPYSEWALGYGRDFDFSQEETKEDPEDFDYVAIVESFLNRPVLRLEDLEGFLFAFDTAFDGAAGAAFRLLTKSAFVAAVDKENPGDRPQSRLVFYTSLRKRNINPSFQAPQFIKTEPSWEKPEGLDPDKAVIIATIDDGINFAHERFRIKDGNFQRSRVDFAWVQDGVADPDQTDIPFGREFTRPDIEAAINDNKEDETSVLDALGMLDFSRFGFHPMARRMSHGTHVMDIAAGENPDGDKADLIHKRLITVQLPALTTLETSGSLLGLFLLASVQYILARAERISKTLGKAVPVIINFSFGLSGGPHNGRHFIERAIASLIEDHRARMGDDQAIVDVVLPAGNRHLMRGYAEKISQSETERTTLSLPWRVQPGDRSSSYLEIWLPDKQDGTATLPFFDLWVTPPGSAPRQLVLFNKNEGDERLSSVLIKDDLEETIIARASLDAPNNVPDKAGLLPSPSPYWRILIALAPTETQRQAREVAPSGLWQVEVSADLTPFVEGAKISAWIQRDDSPLGYRSPGRQSYFDDPHYNRFDATGDWQTHDEAASVVKRGGTLSGIASRTRAQNADNPVSRDFIVIGAYQWHDHELSLYSTSSDRDADGSSLPTKFMRNPDAAAVADTSRIMRGILGAGSRCGTGGVAISGTSVAAPQATRLIAKHLAHPQNRQDWNGAEYIKSLASANETDLWSTGAKDPERAGSGLLPVDSKLKFQIERQ